MFILHQPIKLQTTQLYYYYNIPGFYVAILTYHRNDQSFLLISLSGAREGIPFP